MAGTGTVEGELRAWADGIYETEAAVELLLRAWGGRLAEPGLNGCLMAASGWIRTGWASAARFRAVSDGCSRSCRRC